MSSDIAIAAGYRLGLAQKVRFGHLICRCALHFVPSKLRRYGPSHQRIFHSCYSKWVADGEGYVLCGLPKSMR